MIKKLSERYDQLLDNLKEIELTKTVRRNDYVQYEDVDQLLFDEWKVKARSLIVKTCGENGVHIKAFTKAEEPQAYEDLYERFKRVKPVFLAAKDDFQGGYLSSVRNLVQAEIFDSEIEQASELLSSGYKGPAAVVAGVILETSLRDICDQNSIPHGKLDKMNSDLAKAGVYSKLQQKRITALADIRNNAAHGHWDLFSGSDVSEMIRDVKNFLRYYLV
ncbi:hypothetical protein Misp06_00786 [Microbulbifer sp. NBRC 101763]|uniref:hypothetical protein n=1 Tax=Microbulbifer sp. NBRC 101763 TaxID=1113820 RepID=UPI003097DA49